MLLSVFAKVLGSDTGSHPDMEISWLLTDSRMLTFPAESAFFALVSSRNNGHKFIPELYNQGVRVFVVSEPLDELKQLPDTVFISVPDTLRALQQLAAFHRAGFDISVIGITGSNGKTVVKEWLSQMLHQDKVIVRSPRSYNSQIGVPLSVWQLNEHTQTGIFEAGISEPGEMDFLERVIRPTVGIFTNIGDAHRENFDSEAQKISEKLKLFSHVDTLIYCADQQAVSARVTLAGLRCKLISWGGSESADVRLLEVKKDDQRTELVTEANQQIFTFCIPFTDEASVENAMHCITLMWHLGYSNTKINERLSLLEAVAMRMEVREGKKNCLIINDSYNSDLNSLNIAMDLLVQQSISKKLKPVLILSDIMQSGYEAPDLYNRVAELLKAKQIHKIIGIGKLIGANEDSFGDLEKYFFTSTSDFIQSDIFDNLSSEVVLLKGSRQFQFESISEKLALIAHETVMEVNLNALIDNFNYFRSLLKPDTRVMCMVKAFAYGSGSVEIARTLQHHGCHYLAVAVADEGAELRHAGIRIPLIVMNPEISAFETIFEHQLEPEIYSFKLLKEFIYAAGRHGLTDYPIHIKIDSGMHRLGFDPEEVNSLIDYLEKQNQIKVRSVFSHLAGADNPDLDAFTQTQARVFMSESVKFTRAFSHQIMKHILNSAGTERFTDYQFDMVRLGIGLYGVSAIPGHKLRQVCVLKTIILQIKWVRSGETVGYNRNGKLHTDRRIAVLPIGYADGYDRELGNGLGEVWIAGKRAKVVGNVSMDLIAVDVTGLDVREGDPVEIFGDHITISEIAEKLHTIPYEVLTGISRRVKRIYFQE